MSLRNTLLEQSSLFLTVYCFYLRILEVFLPPEERRSGLGIYRTISKKFPQQADLQSKVCSRFGAWCIRIPLAPNWLLARKWSFGAKEFQITNLRWEAFFLVKQMRLLGFWQDTTIYLGKAAEIAVRWCSGQRKYVAFLFWIRRMKSSSFSGGELRGRFEFYHELWKISPGIAVSRWWWGSIWLYSAAERRATEPYHHFGKLIRWHWNGRRKGIIGVDLSPGAKELVYRKFCGPKAPRAYDTQRYLDAVTGSTRNFKDECFPACCIDCGVRFHPYTGESPNWLRCEDCEEKWPQLLWHVA